ncbi:hypothetical protein ACFQBY_00770 [Promicromonospora citrea]|uniref:Uncharacterized protein n=1 Tax=Promicromonospora citrea TaxID=43677 RepID=A0A8H9GLM7_9MICO|nr:hypothetical protein [Promicromonospora citrea]GGM37849.1 hypothetical protein GCM10010102_36830 [Promicromonospora citrea]
MTRVAYPYLRPHQAAVEPSAWTLVLGDEPVVLPEALDTWDYNLDLRLRRSIRVDVETIRAQCRLPEEAVLDVCVVWRSSGSGLFGRAAAEHLTEPGVAELDLEVVIPGSVVGGVLDIDTVVVLATPCARVDPLAPWRAGSMIWEQRSSIRLQGDASQFPISVIDFAGTSLPEGAAWHLQISGSLESAAMGSLLLLVNARHKQVAEAFGNAGKPRPVDRLVLSAVHADIARVMVEHALASDEFDDDAEYDEETLGAMLRDVFVRVFGQRTVKDVRLRAKDNPSLVATEVQAAVNIFGGDR